PQVDVAGAAVVLDEDDRPGAAARLRAATLPPQQVGQPQAAHAEAADAQQLSPRRPVVLSRHLVSPRGSSVGSAARAAPFRCPGPRIRRSPGALIPKTTPPLPRPAGARRGRMPP